MSRGRIGDYQILAQLARTKVYASYDAFHVVQRRSAVLKLAYGAHGQTAAALVHEAAILGLLRHPGVPAIQASGTAADGRFWIATERVSGDVVGAHGALGAGVVAELLRDVAAVLEHAHLRGILARSLRPDTIGLADPVRGIPTTITEWADAQPTGKRAPLVAADPAYVAPELVRGTVSDVRADIYALGAIAYRALCGVAPSSQAAVPARMYARAAPHQLVSLIDRMLAHDPRDRPARADEVRQLAIRIVDELDVVVTTTHDGERFLSSDHLRTDPEISLAG